MTDQTMLSPLPTAWPELDDPTLLEKIIDIIAKEGQVDKAQITPGATLDSLGLASMDVVTILMGVEERLDTYLPMDSSLSSARNLSEFITSIASAVQSNKQPKAPAAD
jgi:acyl carrier protein